MALGACKRATEITRGAATASKVVTASKVARGVATESRIEIEIKDVRGDVIVTVMRIGTANQNVPWVGTKTETRVVHGDVTASQTAIVTVTRVVLGAETGTADQTVDQTADQIVDQIVHQIVHQTADQIVHQIVNQTADQIVDQIVDQTANQIVDQTAADQTVTKVVLGAGTVNKVVLGDVTKIVIVADGDETKIEVVPAMAEMKIVSVRDSVGIGTVGVVIGSAAWVVEVVIVMVARVAVVTKTRNPLRPGVVDLRRMIAVIHLVAVVLVTACKRMAVVHSGLTMVEVGADGGTAEVIETLDRGGVMVKLVDDLKVCT